MVDKKVITEVILNIRPSAFEITPKDYGYEALLVAILSKDFISAEECNRIIRGKVNNMDSFED